jgi:hypothetical protein
MVLFVPILEYCMFAKRHLTFHAFIHDLNMIGI